MSIVVTQVTLPPHTVIVGGIGPPGPPGPPGSSMDVLNWKEPVSTFNNGSPELIFTDTGDVVMTNAS